MSEASMSDEPGYTAAMAELQTILEELEGEHLDVDVLVDLVRRASELVRICRGRISRAQADVDRIVAELEADEAGAPGDEDGGAGADAPA